MKRSRPIALAAFLAIAAGACSDFAGPESEPMDQIFFLSTRDGAADASGWELTEIYRMNADGSGVENLTHYPTDYGMIASPDGRTVIVSAFRPRLPSWTWETCPAQIWTTGPDGAFKQITQTPGCHSSPKLSPHGTRIALYYRDGEFYVANIDGTEARRVPYALPPVTTSCSATAPPKWHVALVGWASPGRLMFYRYICGEGYTYYSVDLDGSNLRVLDFDVQSAYVSPDGTRIAFNKTGHVWIMNVDGSGARTVVQGALPGRGMERSPWSADGKRIYFQTAEGGRIANVDGDPAIVQLPQLQVHFAEFNGWSPRGDRLAFTLYKRTSETEFTYVLDIYVVNADGTGGVNLTNSAFLNRGAVWVRGRR